jgi:hypothetical protein
MKRWLDPDWYRYVYYRFGPARMFLVVAGLAALFVGGAFTVQALGGSSNSAADAYVPVAKTVMRRVKVIEHGRTIYKRVPVVKRIYAKPVTVEATRTVQTPGGVRVVTHPVVRYQPVYRRRIIHVNGKPVTVSQVVTDTKMLTNTQMLTVTNEHTNTVVQSQTQTVNQTVNQTVTNVRTQTQTQTSPPDTVTVTGPTHTETVVSTATVTQTAPSVTVTLPAVTVTVTTSGG